MKSQYLAGLAAGLSLVNAQTAVPTISDVYTAMPTSTNTDTLIGASETSLITDSAIASATYVPSGEACLAVSSALAAQTAAPYYVNAELASECALSAPIVQEDALLLVDGIMAALEFQSDLQILKDPPEGYLLAGVDLIGELQQIRDQVSSDAFASEIEFEQNVTAVLGNAHDGHLFFNVDGLSVFNYYRPFSLTSVSADGIKTPEVYIYLDLLGYAQGTGIVPVAVTEIDGQDVAQFLQTRGQNVTGALWHDPDALYNNEMAQLNNGGSSTIGDFTYSNLYMGANTTVTFADGTTRSFANYATWNANFPFATLKDGESFYNICCNVTAKKIYLNGGSSGNAGLPQRDQDFTMRVKENSKLQELENLRSNKAVATSTVTSQIPGYPLPIAVSTDQTISGYFLQDSGFEDTAVLVLRSQSESDPVNFLETMTNFMDACRNANKTRLVLDIQGNGGGNIATGYGVFKQLFPDLWPYGANTLRAHEGLDILGTIGTNYSIQLKQQGADFNTLVNAEYYMQYNPTAWLNDSDQPYQSWPEFYGPVDNGVDNYTNLLRYNLNDTNFDLGQGGLIIPGFGNDTGIAPSPFTSDNMIILSNGLCASTCTILSHFLKYQGKVKSIAVGGRPETTAMQAIGGVKGSYVYYYQALAGDVAGAHQIATAAGYSDQLTAIENSKTLSSILNNGSYIIYRGGNAGQGAAAREDFVFNWQNNIAEGDTSYTPLQYVYEAADCHLWYQPQHVGNVSTLWTLAAAQAFGLDNTEVFSLCVNGSTNDPSSLSGNATLYNNGNPTNVTTYLPEQGGTDSENSGSATSSTSANPTETSHNSAGRVVMSGMAVVGAIAVAMFIL